MKQKSLLRAYLVAGFWFIAFGGWLLHFNVHRPGQDPTDWIPFAADVLSLTLLTVLFAIRKTTPYAYVLNGMLVIIGTITMGHVSLRNLPAPVTVGSLFTHTLLADIIIAWGKFMLGSVIFELNLYKTEEDEHRRGRYWRYPNYGWWWVHAGALAAVYAAGYLLWP